MSENNKYENIEKGQEKALYLVGLVLLFVVGLFLYKTRNTNFFNDPEHWGIFGDYVGGTLNPILGFFSFMLLLLNLYLQRKQLDKTEEQLELNRKELELTRIELTKAAEAQVDSAKVMNEQLKTQALQQFDSLFFSLLNQLTIKLSEFQKEPLARQQEYLYKDIFEKSKFHKLETLRANLATQNKLSSFFIFLYQIMKNIDEKLPTDNLKKDYSNVVRSLLPSDINKWLLLNCAVSENHDFNKFKELLVKFEFFEHLEFYGEGLYVSSNLIHMGSLYPIKAYGKNKDSLEIYQSDLLKEFRNTSNFHKILISILENTDGFKKGTDTYKEMSFVKEATHEEMTISTFNFDDRNSDNESYGRISADYELINDFRIVDTLLYLQCSKDVCYRLQLKIIESGVLAIDNIQQVSSIH